MTFSSLGLGARAKLDRLTQSTIKGTLLPLELLYTITPTEIVAQPCVIKSVQIILVIIHTQTQILLKVGGEGLLPVVRCRAVQHN